MNMSLTKRICTNNNMTAGFHVETNHKFLPHLLVELGLFPSGNEVKKNRPDLWCEIEETHWVEIGDIELWIRRVDETSVQDDN